MCECTFEEVVTFFKLLFTLFAFALFLMSNFFLHWFLKDFFMHLRVLCLVKPNLGEFMLTNTHGESCNEMTFRKLIPRKRNVRNTFLLIAVQCFYITLVKGSHAVSMVTAPNRKWGHISVIQRLNEPRLLYRGRLWLAEIIAWKKHKVTKSRQLTETHNNTVWETVQHNKV